MIVKIFTTGGSIDKIYSTQTSCFEVDAPQIGAILQAANLQLEYSIEPLMQKDSLEMDEEDRKLIFEKVVSAKERHVLITHGTDTMIATARKLEDVPGKVIVLTGAMRPAAFVQSDAAFNIGCAILALQILPEGVYVVMNGRVFDPRKARKNLASDRFEDV
jgi:L-asparaginase